MLSSHSMRFGASVFACSFFAFTPCAFAEDMIADNNTIIIVTGQDASNDAGKQIAETAGGTDLVTHEDYADKSLVSLRDALAFSPGIYLQPRYGQEVRISIRGSGLSRGFHMRGLTLLQDGIPINLADDNGDFQELDPSFFKYLEVYRGANALRFGSGTLGGAINGVTPTGRDAAGVYLRGDVGSFETYRGLLSIGGTAGVADYWAAVSADSSDGDRDHAQRNSLRFHGNVGLQISDTISTRFYASVNNINQELPGALNLNTALTAPRTGNFIGDQARDIDSLRLQNRTSFTFGDAILNAGIFLNAKSLYHPIFQVVDQESLDKGGFFRLDWEKDTLALTLGGEARFGTVNSKRFINISGNRGAPTFQADQKARTMNLYAELRYKPVTSLSLIAGGIFANGKRQQQQNFNSFAGGVTDIYGSADFREFSPKFGLLFDVSPEIQFYSNINRSAEFPGFIELAQVASFVPLDAQSAWTYEIGSRGSAGPVSWDVSAYRSDIKGELLQFTVNADIPASTFNAGKTLHQGVEAGLTIKPAAWLRLRQTYNYSDFRFQGDAQFQDNRLPVVPRHVYRADLRIGNDRIHVAPNIEWVPQGAFADYNNALRISGYTLWGLTAGAKLSEKFELFLDARNLTNKKAIGDISAAINASLSSSIFQPIENRAVYGGVRTRF
ncbi:MAG: TonB-dependent receptor [Sphingomonadales bacterium]|nr:TonB-dependent receptor [Sphingomonadales bacterium]